MANALSTGQAGEPAVVLLDAGGFERQTNKKKKIPTDETSGISSSPPLSEGQTQQLAITASQAVLLYWPGELIIDCEPSAYKYACKLLKY